MYGKKRKKSLHRVMVFFLNILPYEIGFLLDIFLDR